MTSLTMVKNRMRCSPRSLGMLCLGMMLGWTPEIHPQGNQVVPASSTSTHEATVLDRIVALKLRRVRLQEALTVLAQRADLQLAYSPMQVPVDRLVSIDTASISVRDALTILLNGTDVIVGVSPSGKVVLKPGAGVGGDADASGVPQQGTATVSGYVRDSATETPIAQATVRVDGTAKEVKSGPDGRYMFSGLAAGDYRVSCRRVGYLAKVRATTVADGQTSTLNFELSPPATKLDEVVTTALGDQRRYQVGNVIATINVDSLAPTTPVTSVTDVISARAPGVEVLESNGMLGAGPEIRIRGENSISLSSDPIIIVDGVRVDNTPGGGVNVPVSFAGNSSSPSRINDLDFSQIASIDILKGPAASTEYGTDASNGVIVITTKHGAAGAVQWHVSADEDRTTVPTSFPLLYYSWGHTTNGQAAAAGVSTGSVPYAASEILNGCPLVGGTSSAVSSTNGQCVVDSVTAFNPLNDAFTSMYQPSNGHKYALSASGGVETIQYYVAANLSGGVGNTQLPPAFVPEALALGYPQSAIGQVNTQQQRSIRSNTAIHLGSTADATISVAYLYTNQNAPGSYSFYYGDAAYNYGPKLPDSAYNFGYSSYNSQTPLGTLGENTSQSTSRLTGGTTANWRPRSWLVVHGTLGLDHGTQQELDIVAPQSNLFSNYGYGAVGQQGGASPTGTRSVGQLTKDVYSGDFRGAATAVLSSMLRSVTSFGLQVADTRNRGLTGYSSNVPEASFGSLDGATNVYVTELGDEAATAGGYLEEQIGFRDRLFLIGALRLDAGSGFYNETYTYAVYPKASASWLVMDRGGTSLRLRASFGANGQQPPDGSALQLFQTNYSQGWLNGQPTNGYLLTAPGNVNLRPERSQEWEGGADIGLAHNRFTLELTYYEKTTTNAITTLFTGFDLDYLPFEENLGTITNDGVEAAITGRLVETRGLTWDVTLNGSINHNELLSFNSSAIAINYGDQQDRVGRPLNAYYGYPIHYTDLNRDGILEYPAEVSEGTSDQYAGPSQPTTESSLSTHIGLWNNTVAIGALFDYRAGYSVENYAAYQSAQSGANADENVPSQAPFWEQARDVVNLYGTYPTALNFESGDLVRFRELSVTYTVPSRWSRPMHLHALSLTGAIRNLALWTRYSGVDPEVTAPSGFETICGVFDGCKPDSDIRLNAGGAPPLTRDWFVRLNVGL